MSKKFTDIFPDDLTYDKLSRVKKAKKIVAVISDYLGNLSKLSCLDLGCSIGYITEVLAKHFKKAIGVDVDGNAISIAKKNIKKSNISFYISHERKLDFLDETFDVIVFNQIYEHVKDPKVIFSEIKRILKKGGVCFFGARNKYGIFDGHYKLPFISWLPRKLANFYLRVFTPKKHYDINLLSLSDLKKLTGRFLVKDYTLKVIKKPEYFKAIDSVPTTLKINLVLYYICRIFYPFIPNYIWILVKKDK